MRIVQSYWSQNKPILLTKCSWVSPEYNLMSWTLSCLQLTQFYKDVVLYADSASAKLLIDHLKLPYTDVKCNLDKLNTYHPDLWALAKIYTYSQQQEPFLHLDHDVYIWKAFDKSLLSSDLIAQSLEKVACFYDEIISKMKAGLDYIPEIMKDGNEKKLDYCYNAGILGGNDIEFFESYCTKAFRLVNKNVHNLSKINVLDFNIFFEQFLFYCLAKKEHKKVDVLLNNITDDGLYKGLGDFMEVPHNKQFLHLIGSYKRYPIVCSELANRLRLNYPEYYYRIISLFKKCNIPLFKNYYYFFNKADEKNLLLRHYYLKERYANNELSKKEDYQYKQYNGEPIFYRTSLVKDAITSQKITTKRSGDFASENETQTLIAPVYELQEKDVYEFEQKLSDVIINKFSCISKDYLYARDINCTQYFQYIFSDKKACYQKNLVKDELTEVIQSQFNWIGVSEDDISSKQIIEQQLTESPASTYTAVIPECDKKGYTLVNIDELDVLLLEHLQQPLSIEELFNEIKPAFDEDDLNSSLAEFELLIFGRIKNALQYKMIKCVM